MNLFKISKKTKKPFELKKPMIVVSAFIKKDDKYLLVKCKKFLDWRVPGGRVETIERIESALRREMKEELNLDIIETDFLGYGQDSRVIKKKKEIISRLVLYFKCSTEGILKPDKNEIVEYKWLNMEDIKKHPNIESAMKDFFSRYELE